jgi:hypothetical protein
VPFVQPNRDRILFWAWLTATCPGIDIRRIAICSAVIPSVRRDSIDLCVGEGRRTSLAFGLRKG